MGLSFERFGLWKSMYIQDKEMIIATLANIYIYIQIYNTASQS